MSVNAWGCLLAVLLAVIIWQNWQAASDRAYVVRVVDHIDAGTAELLTRE